MKMMVVQAATQALATAAVICREGRGPTLDNAPK
jgi:hypothetical protein